MKNIEDIRFFIYDWVVHDPFDKKEDDDLDDLDLDDLDDLDDEDVDPSLKIKLKTGIKKVLKIKLISISKLFYFQTGLWKRSIKIISLITLNKKKCSKLLTYNYVRAFWHDIFI